MILRLTMLLACLAAIGEAVGQVRINEAVNSNSTVEDNDGDTPDWFELYNAGSEQSLAGWSVTDDPDEPQKWIFGDISLAAGEYFVVWASGKGRSYDPVAGVVHANFRISSQGETLYLFDRTGRQVSRLWVADLIANVSIGIPPGGGAPQVYADPTPGSANSTTGASGVVDEVVRFNYESGRYTPLALTLSGAPAAGHIRYTTDGNPPVDTSTLYTGPIELTTHTVIQARIFVPGSLPSQPATRSYFIDDEHALDIVSLVSEPAGFFDEEDGIYVMGAGASDAAPFYGANFWADREVSAYVDLLPADGAPPFSQALGLKIYGGASRSLPQRSLSLFARGRYGDGDMDYPFFPNRPYDEYEALVLRNSGQDWLVTMLADLTMTGLMDGSGLDVQAGRPVATYLNGEYWGLYNLREKINEHFLAARHGVDPDSLIILEGNGVVIEGRNDIYYQLLNFVRSEDLSIADNYRYVADRIDVDNFILYQLVQIYIDNYDWPGNNNKYWRHQRPGGKWRWILFDTDFGAGIFDSEDFGDNSLAFALEEDGPSYPNPPWATVFLRKLTGNEEFRHQFINQFADEMNSRFLADAIIERIDANAARIAAEIPRAFDRWGEDAREWGNNLERMRRFFRERPPYMRQFIQQEFDLPGAHLATVTVADTSQGYVELNSLKLHEPNWCGIYFESVPIRLKAVAKPGYVFDHWRGDPGASAEFEVDLLDPTKFEPIFRPVGATPSTARPDAQPLKASVYPNPAQDQITVKVETACGTEIVVQLFDMQGSLLRAMADVGAPVDANLITMSVADLPNGAYLVRVVQADGDGAEVVFLK